MSGKEWNAQTLNLNLWDVQTLKFNVCNILPLIFNVCNVQILNSSVLNALMLLLLLNARFAKRMTMAATFLSKKKQRWVTHRHFWLRNDDGDGNKNVKMTTLYALHIFLHISLLSPPDYDVKMPNFTFYGERKQSMTIFFLFLNLSEVPRKQINSRGIYL